MPFLNRNSSYFWGEIAVVSDVHGFPPRKKNEHGAPQLLILVVLLTKAYIKSDAAKPRAMDKGSQVTWAFTLGKSYKKPTEVHHGGVSVSVANWPVV